MLWLILIGFGVIFTPIWLAWALLGTFLRRPRIRLHGAKQKGRDGAQILVCEVINDPIYFGPLTMLGVKRAGFDEVSSLFSIASATTQEPIVSGSLAAWHDRGENHSYTAPLPASAFGLSFPVAVMEAGGFASAINEATHVPVLLVPDTYECTVYVHADELYSKIHKHHFVVGVEDDCFQWADGDWKRFSTPPLRRLGNKLLKPRTPSATPVHTRQ
jgi:hypothetical protein